MDDLSCSNPDCKIAETGSCLQGHNPVESCPNFGEPLSVVLPSEDDGDAPIAEAEIPVRTKIRLPTGQPFGQSDVDAFLLGHSATMVAIVGDTSSGKSTLLCSIYDQYLRRRFAGRSFAGSATLMAFEQIAHDSRAASGAITPDTRRTSLSEGPQFYHLATASEDTPGTATNLFLSDRAGESYRAGLDRPEEFSSFPELHLAKVIAVLVDGARLISTEEQHEVLDTARQLVRAMMDSETLGASQHLQLILTKRDVVERSGEGAKYVARAAKMADDLRRDFGHALASVTFFEIAARDPQQNYPHAYGCDLLLQSWVHAPDPKTFAVEPTRPVVSVFDRLSLNLTYGSTS